MCDKSDMQQSLSCLYDGQLISDSMIGSVLQYSKTDNAKKNLLQYETLSFIIKNFSNDSRLYADKYTDISSSVINKIDVVNGVDRGGPVFFIRGLYRDFIQKFKYKKTRIRSFNFSLNALIASIILSTIGIFFIFQFETDDINKYVSDGDSVLESAPSVVVLGVDKSISTSVMIRDPKLDELLMVTNELNDVHSLQKPAEYLRNSSFTNEQ